MILSSQFLAVLLINLILSAAVAPMARSAETLDSSCLKSVGNLHESLFYSPNAELFDFINAKLDDADKISTDKIKEWMVRFANNTKFLPDKILDNDHVMHPAPSWFKNTFGSALDTLTKSVDSLTGESNDKKFLQSLLILDPDNITIAEIKLNSFSPNPILQDPDCCEFQGRFPLDQGKKDFLDINNNNPSTAEIMYNYTKSGISVLTTDKNVFLGAILLNGVFKTEAIYATINKKFGEMKITNKFDDALSILNTIDPRFERILRAGGGSKKGVTYEFSIGYYLINIKGRYVIFAFSPRHSIDELGAWPSSNGTDKKMSYLSYIVADVSKNVKARMSDYDSCAGLRQPEIK